MIHRHRGNRIKRNYQKAVRKEEILKFRSSSFGFESLHRLVDGKVHCSCCLCRAKTGGKQYFSTNDRYGKNWKPSDRRQIDELSYKETEYKNGGSVYE